MINYLEINKEFQEDSCGGCGIIFPLSDLTDLTRPNYDPNMVYSCAGCL